jgi:hypothetical protein
MSTLNDRIEQLEKQVNELLSKIADLSKNTEEKPKTPYTISGGQKSSSLIMPIDAKSGLGLVFGNHVLWNDTDSSIPLFDADPEIPTKGYNKHSHGRFSGGALIKGTEEVVEYKVGVINNPECQLFYDLTDKDIETDLNSNDETVKKIGKLDLVFNPDGGVDSEGNPIGTWGVATYEINVKKCYLVERDVEGNIAIDSKGQEKKSPLWNEDTNKTSIIWDENGNCWRFLAVYAPGEEE